MSGAWGKLSYGSWDHEKVEAAGNRAWGTFLRAVAWSGLRGKDGFVSGVAMRRIERDPAVWRKLLTVGLLDSIADDGCVLHDFSHHNETTGERAAREENYSKRGKKAASARWGSGREEGDEGCNDASDGMPPDARSRESKTDQDQERKTDHDRASAPTDPFGIAPPGEDPDAYPGSVPPLTLSAPSSPKPRAKKPPKGPRPDIDPATLNPEAFAAYEAIRACPTFGPITIRPAEAARDFAVAYPRLDLAQAIREIGVRVRALDKSYTNGAATLANWLPNSRCYRTSPARAPAPPPGPEAPRRRWNGPVGPQDPIKDQIQYFVDRGITPPPPLVALREKELAAEAAAKEAAAAADAPPVVGPKDPPLDDEDVPF